MKTLQGYGKRNDKDRSARSQVRNKRASADVDGLPPGWLRLESRSKPGSYFYAHPATKRTQVERPGFDEHPPSKRHRVAPPKTKAAKVINVDERAEGRSCSDLRDRGGAKASAEEVEAEEAAREELVRRARVEKRSWELAVKDAEQQAESAHESEDEISKEELERWKEKERRREEEEASAELRRREEEQIKMEELSRQQAEEEKQRRAMLREMERKEEEYEEARRIAWKKRAEEERQKCRSLFQTAAEVQASADPVHLQGAFAPPVVKHMSPETLSFGTPPLALSRKAPHLAPPVVVPSLNGALARAPTSVASSSGAVAKAVLPAEQTRVPEPPDEVIEQCLDVIKSGERVDRFALKGAKQRWTIGRAADQVDFVLHHESVSRKHAEITRQGMLTFLTDLGSAHGTIVDGQKLVKFTPMRLSRGSNISFGGSSKVYMFREPGLRS